MIDDAAATFKIIVVAMVTSPGCRGHWDDMNFILLCQMSDEAVERERET